MKGERWLPNKGTAGVRPLCSLCGKPIKGGKVYYQAGLLSHPCHKGCRVAIKKSKDGGI